MPPRRGRSAVVSKRSAGLILVASSVAILTVLFGVAQGITPVLASFGNRERAQSADLELVSVLAEFLPSSRRITTSIDLTNNGPATVKTMTLKTTLPEGMIFASARTSDPVSRVTCIAGQKRLLKCTMTPAGAGITSHGHLTVTLAFSLQDTTKKECTTAIQTGAVEVEHGKRTWNDPNPMNNRAAGSVVTIPCG